MSITLYQKVGWIDAIKGLEQFGIVPEIRAQGTISKGYSSQQYPVKLDYFLVHVDPEPTEKTVTLPKILKCYKKKQEDLKTLCVGIPSPDLSFKAGRFKYGKKSGVLCSSDDNIIGKPLMDLKSKDITLEQGVIQECKHCPFNEDRSCKETVLVMFTINAPSIDSPSPFGQMLFRMTLPRTARNPFFGDYALAMGTAYNAVLRYGLDHKHFPQSMVPFHLSLVLRTGQYYDTKTKSQTKTTYYIPRLKLDEERLYKLLERFADQFNGRQLYVQEQKLLPEHNPIPYKTIQQKCEAEAQRLRGVNPEKAEEFISLDKSSWSIGQWDMGLKRLQEEIQKTQTISVEDTTEQAEENKKTESAEHQELCKEIIHRWDIQDYHYSNRINSLKKQTGMEVFKSDTLEGMLERLDVSTLSDYLIYLAMADNAEEVKK